MLIRSGAVLPKSAVAPAFYPTYGIRNHMATHQHHPSIAIASTTPFA